MLMWTDEQLTEQGWSVEQIVTYRTEEATQAVTVAADQVISETINLQPAHPDKILPALDGASEASMNGAPQMLTQSSISAILLVAMLVLVPFSLYSISNAEGTQGPSGESGIAGINGSDGSSFHLVSSTDALPVCDATVNNQIFFIAVDAAFQVCQNSIWTPIESMAQMVLMEPTVSMDRTVQTETTEQMEQTVSMEQMDKTVLMEVRASLRSSLLAMNQMD
jgi:hypothetical protein